MDEPFRYHCLHFLYLKNITHIVYLSFGREKKEQEKNGTRKNKGSGEEFAADGRLKWARIETASIKN